MASALYKGSLCDPTGCWKAALPLFLLQSSNVRAREPAAISLEVMLDKNNLAWPVAFACCMLGDAGSRLAG